MTWRQLIKREMSFFGESLNDVISERCDEKNWLDIEFDNGFGLTEGPSFTVWTKNRVYFPVQYDGSEWCGSVPRHPCYEVVRHIGSG